MADAEVMMTLGRIVARLADLEDRVLPVLIAIKTQQAEIIAALTAKDSPEERERRGKVRTSICEDN